MAGSPSLPGFLTSEEVKPDDPDPTPGTCRVSRPLGALIKGKLGYGHVSDQTRLGVPPSEH
jgi:hypothetical protein